MQLQREVWPVLSALGASSYLVGIGTSESGREFAEKTGFDPATLMADPDNAAYDALEFRRGVKATFLSKEVCLGGRAAGGRSAACALHASGCEACRLGGSVRLHVAAPRRVTPRRLVLSLQPFCTPHPTHSSHHHHCHFTPPQTGVAIKERQDREGGTDDLKAVLKQYKL